MGIRAETMGMAPCRSEVSDNNICRSENAKSERQKDSEQGESMSIILANLEAVKNQAPLPDGPGEE